MPSAYEDKRENIKKIAVKYFTQYGYHKTTLDDIAAGLGIKKNSLYYYFPNKESLFSELINDEVDSIFLEIEDELSRHNSPQKQIEAFIKKLIRISRDRSKIYAIRLKIFVELGDIIETKLKNFSDRAVKKLKQLLDKGIKAGELKKHNTLELSKHIITITNSIEFREFRLASIDSFDKIDFIQIEKSILSILDYMLAGVKK